MKCSCSVFLLFVALATPFRAGEKPAEGLAGRWDLTVKTQSETYPSWIEIKEVNGSPQVRVQGRVSSVHPVENLNFDKTGLAFESSEWFGKKTKVTWRLDLTGDQLHGTQKREGGVEGKIVGVRAPALNRPMPDSWTEPIALFNGKDLTGWKPDDAAANHWKAEGGDLVNERPGANIQTTRQFQDFRLHIEYNCPQDGNSGIYLRGRYEVQVAYEPPGQNDRFHSMGAIYGFIAAEAILPDKPGQWETFDITLVGRHVTVIRDGVKTISNQEIPGITGGALDSREGEPNVLYIQGDHTGGMKYRNITVSVPASK